MAQTKTTVAQGLAALFTAGLSETPAGRVASGQLTGAFQCPHCNQTITLLARFTDASLKDSSPSHAGVGHVTQPDVPAPNKEVISLFLDSNVSHKMKEVSFEKEVSSLHCPGPIRPQGGGATWADKAQVAELPLETRVTPAGATSIPLLDGASLALLNDHPPDTALTRRNRPVSELFHLTPPPGPKEEKVVMVESVIGPKREVPIPGEAFPLMYEICFGATNYQETRRLSDRQKKNVAYVLALMHDTDCDLSRLKEFWSWWKKWSTFPNPTPVLVHEHWGRFLYETAHDVDPTLAASPIVAAAQSSDEQFDTFQRNIEQAWASGEWRPGT